MEAKLRATPASGRLFFVPNLMVEIGQRQRNEQSSWSLSHLRRLDEVDTTESGMREWQPTHATGDRP